MFAVMAEPVYDVMAAQPGTVVGTLTVLGVVAALVGIAALQARSLWRREG